MAKDAGIGAGNNHNNSPGLGGLVSGFMGSTNNYQASAPDVDPNAYQYGGRAGYAQETSDRYRNQAEQAQNRQGVQANYAQADQSRQAQGGLAAAMNARAMGQTPSIAQMQADRQMQQANAAQASASASARGAAGIAMAQQNAANNVANSQAAISNQAQINAANERMQAEQAAFGAYGNMRGQDAQQAQFQAGLQDAQRGRNDAMTMGMTQNEMGVQNSQLAAQQNQQAQQSSNQLGASQINAGIAGQNAQMNQQNGQNVISSIGNVAGKVFGLADGGHMSSPKPYLVGERGPELVIPKKDGFVIPAEITAKMLAGKRANGGDVNAPTSTWGVGRGQTESMTEADNWKRSDEVAQAAIDQRELDNRLATSGGLAVPGGPGTGTTIVEPLRRADQETIATAKAKQAEGIELTPKEERKAAGAQYRESGAKKEDRKQTASAAPETAKGGGAWQQAVDTSYHGPTSGYIPPHLIQIAGPRAMGGPMKGIGAPSGFGTSMDQLAAVHHEPSIAELNQSTFRQPGTAKMMMPGMSMPSGGMALANGGPMNGCRADGGPVDGSGEVVPLYSPPGKWLQSTPEGRAYYIDEPKPLQEQVDPTRPSLAKVMAPQPKESPIAASAPVALPPSQTKPKKMSDDQLMAWANSLQKDMQAEHDQRMAQGPSVSLASRMGRR